MLQNMEYLAILLTKMLNFDNISGMKTSLKVPTNGKGIPYNNLTPCKLSILRENTYEIWIKLWKGQKKKKKKKGKKKEKKWNVG